METGRQTKLPFYMTRPDQQPFFFAMAGLWESWRDKTVDNSQSIETCTIITTTANETVAGLHDRMPVILDEDARQFWLDKELQDPDPLEKLLVPCPADTLVANAVSQFVNKVANDSPDCIVAL